MVPEGVVPTSKGLIHLIVLICYDSYEKQQWLLWQDSHKDTVVSHIPSFLVTNSSLIEVKIHSSREKLSLVLEPWSTLWD